jgi:hypothetical protein
MSDKNSANASINFGWVGLLGVVLVILKVNPGSLLDSPVQNWSWWLVTLPFWGGLAIVLCILALAALGVLIGELTRPWRYNRRRARQRRQVEEARAKRR